MHLQVPPHVVLGGWQRMCCAGKTTAAIHTLRMWSKCGLKPLLATADGNIAVDNIAEGLMKMGLKVVRVGQPEKIREHLQHATLDRQVKKAKEEAALERRNKAERRAAVDCLLPLWLHVCFSGLTV